MFYVLQNDGKYVPARVLTDDAGKPIENPNYLNPFLDGSGNIRTDKRGALLEYGESDFLMLYGENKKALDDQSDLRYYIVPDNLNTQEFLAREIDANHGDVTALKEFYTGDGNFQVDHEGGNSFTLMYTDSNSYLFGQANSVGNVDASDAAGLFNIGNAYYNGLNLDTSGYAGNPQRNVLDQVVGEASFLDYNYAKTNNYLKDNIDNRYLNKDLQEQLLQDPDYQTPDTTNTQTQDTNTTNTQTQDTNTTNTQTQDTNTTNTQTQDTNTTNTQTQDTNTTNTQTQDTNTTNTQTQDTNTTNTQTQDTNTTNTQTQDTINGPGPGVPPFKIIPPDPHDPLVLDLTGRGLQLTSLTGSRTYFDYTGAGFAEKTGWVARGEGLLVLQPGSQPLTSVTAENLIGAVSGDGFSDLAQLDSNGDGKITSADAAFRDLRVWMDSNQNGVLDSGELFTLSDLKIDSIDVSGPATKITVSGNQVVETANFDVVGDADPHTIGEVNFLASSVITAFEVPEGFKISQDALKLPELDGYGHVANLQVAMTLDSTLMEAVTSLMANAPTMSGSDFQAAFQALVQEWAGASNIDPASRGPDVDARHLAVVYAFYGIDQNIQTVYQINPNWHSGPLWESIYQDIVNELEVRFASQLALSYISNFDNSSDIIRIASSPFLAFSLVKFDTQTDRISVDFQSLVSAIVELAPTSATEANSYYNLSFKILESLRLDLFNDSTEALISSTLQALAKIDAPVDVQQAALIAFGSTTSVNESTATGNITVPGAAAVFVGSGDKQISGGFNDVYVVSPDFGNDTIADGGGAALLILQNIAKSDVSFQHPVGTNNLLVVSNATGNVVTLQGYFGRGESATLSFCDGILPIGDVASVLQTEAAAAVKAELATDPSLSNIASALASLGFEAAALGEADQVALSVGANAYVIAGSGNDDVTIGTADSNATTATVLYRSGAGNLKIDAHTNYYNAFSNTLELTNLNASDIILARSENDLTVTVNATGKIITVTAEFNSRTHDGIQQIAFADGTILTRDQIQASAWYRAGAGDVTVTAQDGNATLAAGAGNDTLVGGDGYNDGTSDTFVYAKADGNLDIEAHVPGYNNINNTLELTDLNQADVTLSRVAGDLLVTVNTTGRVVTVTAEFNSRTHDGIQQIAFADGTILTRDQIQASAWYRAGAGDVTVTAQDGNATLAAGAGNDTLVGGDGYNDGTSDTFVYAKADGNLDIEAHVPGYNNINNTLELTDLNQADVTLSRVAGDLLVTVNTTGRVVTVTAEFNSRTHDGIQQIAFADGTILTRDQIQASAWYRAGAGDVTVTAQDGNATLAAGAGNDTLVGGDGYNDGTSDTFVYAKADGNLDIEAHVPGYNNINNTLELTDLNQADVTLSRVAGDLLVTVNTTGRVITVTAEFNSRTHDGIQQIAFADGTILTRDQIQASAWYRAGAGDVTVTAQDGNATLAAGAGNDTLVGGDGYNDGTSDTFVYAKADGNLDIEADVPGYNNINNTLELTDLNQADVTLSRVAGDLLVTVNTTGRVITVTAEFNSRTHDGIQQIAFADGTILTRDQIQASAWYRAGAGDVTVTAQDGNATLAAGAGNDTLVGGDGYNDGTSDTFVYMSADGNLDIEAHVPGYNNINNTLELTDLNQADVTLSRVAGDLLVTVNTTGRVVTVTAEFNSRTHDGIQQIAFADGTILTRDQIQVAAAVRDSQELDGQANITYNLGAGDHAPVTSINNGATQIIWDGTDGNEQFYTYSNQSKANAVLAISNLASTNVSYAHIGNNLVVTNTLTGKALTIVNEFHNQNEGLGNILFSQDGVSLNNTQIAALAVVEFGATENDTVYVAGSGTVVDFGIGDHTVTHYQGETQQTYLYASQGGNDNIEVYTPTGTSDVLKLTDLNASDVDLTRNNADLIVSIKTTGKSILVQNQWYDATSNRGVSAIMFADGTSLDRIGLANTAYVRLGSSDNDTTYVPGSGTTVDFGTGDHTVTHYQGETEQTYLYASQGGNDNIEVYTPTGTSDVLKLTDLNASDVELTRDNADLIIGIKSTGKSILVQNQWYDASGDRGVSAIDFSDGTSLNQASIESLAWYRAGNGASGTATAEADGSMLAAGTGSDTLVDGFDHGTFIYSNIDGDLTIRAHSNGPHFDTLKLTDLNASDVTLSRTGGDLLIGVKATNHSIVVAGEFYSDQNDGIQKITFADGTGLTLSQITSMSAVRGTPGSSDHAYDSRDQSNLTYDLGAGDHGLVSTFHDDPLAVVWDKADGNESFSIESNNYTNDATLRMTGLTQANLQFSRVGNDLSILDVATQKTMTIANEFAASFFGVATIVFDDGSSLNPTQIAAMAYVRDPEELDGQSSVTYDLGAGDHAGVPTFNDAAASFIWDAADGNEIFYTYSSTGSANAVLSITGMTESNIEYARKGNDLIVKNIATGKTLTIDAQFHNANEGLGTINFTADGVSLNNAQIAAQAYVRDPEELDGQSSVTYDLGAGDHAGVPTFNDAAASFIWDAADGNEIFYTYSSTGSANAVLSITGMTESNIEYARNGNDLIVKNIATGKTIAIDAQFHNQNEGISNIVFTEDGISLDRTQIGDSLSAVGTLYKPASTGSDNVTNPQNSGNSFYNVSGDATIDFPENGDVGVASDYNNYGSNGSQDIWNYNSSDGNVWIRKTSGTADILNFQDIASTDVTFSLAYNRYGSVGTDLIATVNATGKQVTIDNFDFSSYSGPDIFKFSDGVRLTHDQVGSLAAQNGIVQPAVLRLGPQAESINLTTPYGSPLEANVVADQGDGMVATSGGNDAFIYASVDGNLNIQAHSNSAHFDSLNLTDLNFSDVTFSRNGGDLLIGVNATSHAITVAGEFNNPDQDGIQKVAFANGVTFNHDQIVAAANPPS